MLLRCCSLHYTILTTSKEYDLRNTQSIEESVRHSDIVYNLIGRDYTTKNFDFEDVHIDGTHRIADAVAKYDIDRYVQVSSHSALADSPSEFYRTKARGEKVARDVFPETTIVRPAPIFGFEDRLLHSLANVSNVITSNHMQERFHPVHVVDVADALERMLYDDSTAGETYELYGPKQYQLAEIKELVDREILKTRRHVNIPRQIMAPLGDVLNKLLWWPTTSRDQVVREFLDQVIDPKAKTFKDLGIEPGDIAAFTFLYLVSLRFLPSNIIMTCVLTTITARISQFGILRPAAYDRAGEEGREEVPARHRRPIDDYVVECFILSVCTN